MYVRLTYVRETQHLLNLFAEVIKIYLQVSDHKIPLSRPDIHTGIRELISFL